jgi:hypothetical protein
MNIDAITMPNMGTSKSVYIQMRVDEHFKARVQKAADRRGVDVTSLFMHAITAQYPEIMGLPDDGQGQQVGTFDQDGQLDSQDVTDAQA